MICSAQTIRALCMGGLAATLHPMAGRIEDWVAAGAPMIDPYREAYEHNGKSGGLGPSTYDVAVAEYVYLPPRCSSLASTVERFHLPPWLQGRVHDKSSWRRKFLSVGSTIIDPGWRGYCTIELSNHNHNLPLEIHPGTPIAQVAFEYLDDPTCLPYAGKYQDQAPGPQEAR